MAQRIAPQTKMLGGLIIASGLSLLAPGCPAYLTNKAIGASKTLRNAVFGIEEKVNDNYRAPEYDKYIDGVLVEEGPLYQVPPKPEGPMTPKAAEALAILMGMSAAGVLTYRAAHGRIREETP